MTKSLRYHGTNEGFCRVYYRDENPESKTLYAMQEGSLFVCSRDGEPSHEVNAEMFHIPESKGSASIDKELNVFLAARNIEIVA